jgi:hypothetical protein
MYTTRLTTLRLGVSKLLIVITTTLKMEETIQMGLTSQSCATFKLSW